MLDIPIPDPKILARRTDIIAGLAPLVRSDALIVSEEERRAYETDGLTAHRRSPLAVVLPSTTEEVSAVLRFCCEEGVKVVARRCRDVALGRGDTSRRCDRGRTV